MIFHPRPENDFAHFIQTYFDRCRAVCPKIRAIGGKWKFEDLIPGLSDFDTRFIVSNDTSVDDWAAMSIAIGRVHSELAKERPPWARILEHLPGLNLTFAEMCDPIAYYPEFHHWSFYHGDEVGLADVSRYLRARPWDTRDEAFHLKKFATYFGPYQRGIDPPVNLEKWESKYPLHSRYMHYFTPPVQAAVSIVRKRAVHGKLESLHAARDMFPNPRVIDQIFDALDRHYEIAPDYEEPRLTEIERELEGYLNHVYRIVVPHVTLLKLDDTLLSPQALREQVARLPMHPAQQFFDSVRFCRLMKGRLLFYAEPIAWFDTTFLIHNELGRIVKSFYTTPLKLYGQVRFGEAMEAADVLARITGSLVSNEDARGMNEFVRVASIPIQSGTEKTQARAVAETIEPVLRVTEALGGDLRHHMS